MQRALTGLYARFGPRVVYVVYGANIGIGLLTGLLAIGWATGYLALGSSDFTQIAAILVFGGGPGAVLIVWASRDLFRTPLSWVGEHRTLARAPLVWESLVTLPYAVARRAFLAGWLLMFPFTLLVLALGIIQPWYTAVPFYLSAVATVLAAGVLWTFGGELALRPMLRDVAAYLPSDFEPTVRNWSLHAKSLAPLPVVTLFGALTTGAFVDAVPRGAGRLALALAIAFGTVCIAGLVFVVVTRTALDPMEDLVDATRRVSAGDLVTPVPIVTADDFGWLAYSFNAMLGTLSRHRAELRASHARIVIAGDEARRGVERDLHDGAQQRLVHLHLKLAMAAESVRRDAGTTERLLLEMQQEMVAAISELRELAHGVFPPMLEEGGLVEALADVVERSPIPVTLDGADVRRLAPELEAGVYFSCLEALQNAAKHAGDDVHVVLALGERDGWLRWEVTDDGTGFDDTAALHRGGLLNMADRMRALDGELTISSLPGSGTTITGAVPIQVRRG